MSKCFILSENTEIIVDDQKYLLEKNDVVIIDEGLSDIIKKFGPQAKDLISKRGKKGVNFLKKLVAKYGDKAADIFKTQGKKAFQAAKQGIKTQGKKAFQAAKQGIKNKIQTGMDKFSIDPQKAQEYLVQQSPKKSALILHQLSQDPELSVSILKKLYEMA